LRRSWCKCARGFRNRSRQMSGICLAWPNSVQNQAAQGSAAWFECIYGSGAVALIGDEVLEEIFHYLTLQITA
jgi:hypothetical protein